MGDDTPLRQLEEENQAKFSGHLPCLWVPRTLAVEQAPVDYFDVLAYRRRQILDHYAPHTRTLDLCCATGQFLLDIAGKIPEGIGVDFSSAYVRDAGLAAETRGVRNVSFVCANARDLPFPSGSFGLVFCFSSLYYIPRVDEVLNEVSRVLQSGGIAVLDLGNQYSLNTVVTAAYPDLPAPCHISLRQMRRYLRGAGLSVVNHHAFQMLPLWGDRPRWLRPLLKPRWKAIMQRQVRGRMIDEWICDLPLLQHLAFRHLFICRKA